MIPVYGLSLEENQLANFLFPNKNGDKLQN
jgi:hypothetical protein